MTGKLITGRQLKAARVLAGLKQIELADAAGLHVNSIRYMEAKDRITTAWSVVDRVLLAVESAGVTLTADPAPGVYSAHDPSSLCADAKFARP